MTPPLNKQRFNVTSDAPTTPAPPRPADELPTSLTLFMTIAERRAVIARLRAVDRDRSTAMLICLGLHRKGDQR